MTMTTINSCDGTFRENCDPSRNYNIAQLLSDQGATSTLDYMHHYWLNADGTNEKLWNHEWSAHGTCFSTLEPSCLPSGSAKGAEAVAYCQTIVNLFKTLPTYTWLAGAGITPSTSQTYALPKILSALQTGSGGYTPDVGCSSDGLHEISWYFNLQGSVIDGTFVPINSPGTSSSCPPSGLLPCRWSEVPEDLKRKTESGSVPDRHAPPYQPTLCLHLNVLGQTFSIKKYAPTEEIPSDALSELSLFKTKSAIISITRTAEEISIVCEAERDEGEWKCIKIAGPMEFELTGVICAFATPLRDAGIPVFAISTWNTDYVLVPKGKITDAIYALSA
ncbi:ribonuclease T2-like protein [Lanmaoa asiatica]|nr:ribonuclease T2-like protein [Lanmaoa asiatica]